MLGVGRLKTGRNDFSSLDIDKIRLIYLFTTVGSVVLISIAFLHLLKGDIDMFAFEMLIASGGILNAVLLKITKNVTVAENFILFGMLILICGILVHGGYNRTGIYWIYTYPLLTFFLKGNKTGIIWNFVFFLVVLIFAFLDYKNIVPVAFSQDEIRQALLAYTIVMVLAYIFEEALLKSYKEVSRLAVTDQLTGLYNRHYIFEKLNDEIERAKRFGKKFCLILLDIDDFKNINDRFGHDVGDYVLFEVAQVLRDTTRSVDTVGRLGGEEFIIICPNTDIVGGLIIAEKIRSSIGELNIPDVGRITVSVGVAEFTGEETAHELIKSADTALYRAKRSGKNKVEIYSKNGNVIRFGIDLLKIKKPASAGRH